MYTFVMMLIPGGYGSRSGRDCFRSSVRMLPEWRLAVLEKSTSRHSLAIYTRKGNLLNLHLFIAVEQTKLSLNALCNAILMKRCYICILL